MNADKLTEAKALSIYPDAWDRVVKDFPEDVLEVLSAEQIANMADRITEEYILATQRLVVLNAIRHEFANLTPAEALKKARKAAGLTQKQLSVELEVPLRTIENWEGGQRKPPKYVLDAVISRIRSTPIITSEARKAFIDEENE